MNAKVRALVVEDEWPARNYLVELLQSTGLAEIAGAVSSVHEAKEALAEKQLGVDVAFLDVQLGGGNDRSGLELGRDLAKEHPQIKVVLATAFEQHALTAFELGAIDYLLKPFSEDRVRQCLERVVGRTPARPSGPARIVARRKKSLVFLAPDEIWAFEAADRLTFVHTPHGKFDLDLSLAAIELSIGQTLTRVHRNWLVNASHIKELEREGSETHLFVGGLASQGVGVKVPVSRDRSQAVREMLLQDATGIRRG